MDNEFTVEGECNRCKGTGLYVGMAERDGFAVQCHGCKGTGCTTFRFAWNDFEKRKFLRGVSRVLRVNPGVVARVSSELGLTHLSFGGLAYGRWRDGAEFRRGTEDREHSCPAHFYQLADHDLKPNWEKCIGVGRFSDCEHYASEACWARFDAEQEKGEGE